MRKIQCTLAFTIIVNTTCFGGLTKLIPLLTPYLNEEGKAVSSLVGSVIDTLQLNQSIEMKKAFRNIVFTAFKYDSKSAIHPSPIMKNTGEDMEKSVRNDVENKKKLPKFEKIVRKITGLFVDNPEDSVRWRFLRSVLALEDAAYPEDKQIALKNINEDIKQHIAWKCLSKCGAQYTTPHYVEVVHIKNFWQTLEKFQIIPTVQEDQQILTDPKVLKRIPPKNFQEESPILPQDEASEHQERAFENSVQTCLNMWGVNTQHLPQLQKWIPLFTSYLNEEGKEISSRIENVFHVLGSPLTTIKFPKFFEPTQEMEVKKTLRSIVFTAFSYDAESDGYAAPVMNDTGEEVEKRLGKDEKIKKKLPKFEKIIRNVTGLFLENQEDAEKWRFLRSVISLENAFYTADKEIALTSIDRETKQQIAWKCLSKCGAEYTDQTCVEITHIKNFWEKLRLLPQEQKINAQRQVQQPGQQVQQPGQQVQTRTPWRVIQQEAQENLDPNTPKT
ncbi:hypothetical protein [Holospora curviuscula]|uniref:Uncharacterized protein n=1 Tax=Holospora curviuscula TaxID=1082868 RepID=A0A2S5R929_9PROT|nr:hypothetical protein [Holospora curviuscula]PPE03831.1 hypothetical protein HCUR_00607 [Holospora curviuscula]